MIKLIKHLQFIEQKLREYFNYNALYYSYLGLRRFMLSDKVCQRHLCKVTCSLFFFRVHVTPVAYEPIVYTIQKTLVCFSLDVSWFVLCVEVRLCVCCVFTAGRGGPYTKYCCLHESSR